MIKIDERKIDWKTIEEIYAPSGTLVTTIAKAIHEECKSANCLTGNVLQNWFFENENVSEKRIYEHLMCSDPAGKIDAFTAAACETLWRDKRLCNVLSVYHAVATMPRGKDYRKTTIEKLRPALENIDFPADLFDLIDSDGKVVRSLTPDDLSNCKKDVTLRKSWSDVFYGTLEACKRIFNYDSFSKKYRSKTLVAIGVSVCPYCNRQYISPWGTKEKHSTADIEHFYDKDRYPYLALSFYNFIPSCQICNSRFKLTKDFYIRPYVNPYKDGFGEEARFRIGNLESLIDRNILPILELHTQTDREDIRNSAETFHIEELYQNHCDYAKEIINKAKMFNSTQLTEYLAEYKGLFSSRSELYRTIYGNYLEEENQGKRPLAKLTQDLLFDLSVPIKEK